MSRLCVCAYIWASMPECLAILFRGSSIISPMLHVISSTDGLLGCIYNYANMISILQGIVTISSRTQKSSVICIFILIRLVSLGYYIRSPALGRLIFFTHTHTHTEPHRSKSDQRIEIAFVFAHSPIDHHLEPDRVRSCNLAVPFAPIGR